MYGGSMVEFLFALFLFALFQGEARYAVMFLVLAVVCGLVLPERDMSP